MGDVCQNSHFVDRVFFVFDGLGSNLNFLKGVYLPILDSFDFVDTGVGAVAQFLQDYEILQGCGALISHLVAVAERMAIRALFLARYVQTGTNHIRR